MEKTFELGSINPSVTPVELRAPQPTIAPENLTPDNQIIPGTPDWHEHGNCLGVDPDLFFPERGASTREAKEVCRGCIARLACLEYALDNGEKFGIWGGLSERERRRIRRQRAQARRTI